MGDCCDLEWKHEKTKKMFEKNIFAFISPMRNSKNIVFLPVLCLHSVCRIRQKMLPRSSFSSDISWWGVLPHGASCPMQPYMRTELRDQTDSAFYHLPIFILHRPLSLSWSGLPRPTSLPTGSPYSLPTGSRYQSPPGEKTRPTAKEKKVIKGLRVRNDIAEKDVKLIQNIASQLRSKKGSFSSSCRWWRNTGKKSLTSQVFTREAQVRSQKTR